MSQLPNSAQINWNEFTVLDEDKTTVQKNIKDLEIGDSTLKRVLGKTSMNMYTNTTDHLIGYVTNDTQHLYRYGMTEEQAYADYLVWMKQAEKNFKTKLPTGFLLTQSQYDGLVAFYTTTRSINTVETIYGTFDLKTHILNENWAEVANLIAFDISNPNQTMIDSKTIMLYDNGYPKTRAWLRNQGLQRLRRYYHTTADSYRRTQMEFAYYQETQRFLPGMSEARQREVVAYYRSY